MLLTPLTTARDSQVTETTKQRLLLKAVSLIGMEEVAACLGVTTSLLDAWISGKASMPAEKFSLLATLFEDLSRRGAD